MAKQTYKTAKLKIKPEIAELWASALESKKYKQGTGQLHAQGETKKSKDTFCCLGVLCDLAVQEGVIPEPVLENGAGTYMYGKKTLSGEVLPPAVQKWAGMNSEDPKIVDYEEINDWTSYPYKDELSFATLNDNYGYTFKKIAKLIREGAGLAK